MAGRKPDDNDVIDTRRKGRGHLSDQEASVVKRQSLVDEAVQETFPASDPPAYMGKLVPGAPRRNK